MVRADSVTLPNLCLVRSYWPRLASAGHPKAHEENSPALWDETDGDKVSVVILAGHGETTALSGPRVPQ